MLCSADEAGPSIMRVPIIGMIASHIDHQERLVAFRRCLRSIKFQRIPLTRLYISCSGILHEQAAIAIAEEMKGDNSVCSIHGAKPQSQFSHFRALLDIVHDEQPRSTFILFGDDDDIWDRERVAVYIDLLANQPQDVDGLSLEWAAMPCIAQEAVMQSAVDELLQHGLAGIKHMSVYWMIACTVAALGAFFEAVPIPLVQSKFCDIAFKNYMLDRMHCVRFEADSHEARSLVAKGHWLMFYDNIGDTSEDEDEVELRGCTRENRYE